MEIHVNFFEKGKFVQKMLTWVPMNKTFPKFQIFL
jgi:hypothetical protein